MGDLLHTVDGEPTRGLEISAVVRKIVGPPNARVTLGIRRPRASAHIPPTPVVMAPFQRVEIVLRRGPAPQQAAASYSKVAGIGVLFQKV